MPESGQLTLSCAEETEALGDRLARAVRASGARGFAIYLEGDLGAGKTTLARGFLRGLGHAGRVASPTYTLMEPYELEGCSVCHMDLYRIRSASELLDLGLQDVVAGGSILLVEWPDHGAGQLPMPDVTLRLAVVEGGRRCQASAESQRGRELLDRAGL